MALKVSGTTIIDNSKNIPSGTPSVSGTGARTSSPNTGHIFFDTDEGKLVAYNGTEWV